MWDIERRWIQGLTLTLIFLSHANRRKNAPCVKLPYPLNLNFVDFILLSRLYLKKVHARGWEKRMNVIRDLSLYCHMTIHDYLVKSSRMPNLSHKMCSSKKTACLLLCIAHEARHLTKVVRRLDDIITACDACVAWQDWNQSRLWKQHSDAVVPTRKIYWI